MKKIGVYILKGNRYYVGSTIDLDQRLEQHRSGHTHTTKRIGEWTLERFIPCETIQEARQLERHMKKSKNIPRWLRR